MPQVPECNTTMLELIRIILPSTLVIIGWFVVYQLQRAAISKQDTRKDLRVRVDQLDADLKKLRDTCIDYYTDTTKGPELSTQIKVVTEDIRRQALILSDHFLKNVERAKMMGCLVNLFMAATGGKFESRTRVALTSSDVQLNKLFHNSALLITIFEEGFFEAYPPKS